MEILKSESEDEVELVVKDSVSSSPSPFRGPSLVVPLSG